MDQPDNKVIDEAVPLELARAARIIGATSAGAAPAAPPREFETPTNTTALMTMNAIDAGSAPEGTDDERG